MNPSDSSGQPDDTGDNPRSLTDALLDALVYAPIGLTLDGQELAPELARRGRQHAANARFIGEMAVKGGLRRLDERVADRIRGEGQPAEDAETASPEPTDEPDGEAEVESAGEGDVATSDHLAIPDYDLLAASQVVKRLDGLDADQLEAVRVYEAATRDRRTILHKIARLQG